MSEQNKVKLPVLPEKSIIDRHIPTGVAFRGYTEKQMKDFALSAIAAHIASRSPAPIPEQAASIEGLTDAQIETVWDELPLTGAYSMAEARIKFARAIECLLATQSAKQGAQPDLHNAIMNLPAIIPESCTAHDLSLAYKIGHRDARHAAAELVAASQASVEQAPVAQEVTQQAAKAETAEQALFWPHGATEVACSSCGLTMGESRLLSALKHGELSLAPTPSTVSAPIPAIVREAVEAAFEERAGWRTKIGAAVRALPAAQAATDKSED